MTSNTKRLLLGGVVSGPLFVVVGLAQALTRHGFDLTRQAMSEPLGIPEASPARESTEFSAWFAQSSSGRGNFGSAVSIWDQLVRGGSIGSPIGGGHDSLGGSRVGFTFQRSGDPERS